MKKKTIYVIFISLIVVCIPHHLKCPDTVPKSCTIFTVSSGDTVFFGNNEDYINPNTYYWVSPSTSQYYGGVFFGFDDFSPQGGINEKGLAFDGNGLRGGHLNPQSGLTPFRGHPGLIFLRECSTVEEVITLAQTFDWGTSLPYQLHLADATGDAVVISAGPDGKLAFTRKEMGDGYLVSTNFNLAYYQETERTGLCRRYDTAVGMLDKIGNEDDLTIEYCALILDAVHAEGPSVNTLYSNIFDLKEGIIYLYYWHQFDDVVTLRVQEELAINPFPTRLNDLFPHPPQKITLILESESLLSTYEELRLSIFSDPDPKEKIERAHTLYSEALDRGEFEEAQEHLQTVHELLEMWNNAIYAYIEALELLPTKEIEHIIAAFEEAKNGYDTVGDEAFSKKCSDYIQAFSTLREGIYLHENGKCKEAEEYFVEAQNLFENLGEQEYVDYIQNLSETCQNKRETQIIFIVILFVIIMVVIGLVKIKSGVEKVHS
jgi:tetratricopeptide (TPR) repeat protein